MFKEQFIFIYDALLESIKSGDTELTEHNYKIFIENLNKVDDYGVKYIEKQFEVCLFYSFLIIFHVLLYIFTTFY